MEESKLSNEKILIVDDEEHIRELLKYNLKNNSYECITAKNGLEAVEMVKYQRPRLVLLDLILPQMNGYEVCKAIREDNEISTTPIIILSSKDDEFDKLLGFNLGADDYITKPFSVRELITRIKVLLRRSSLELIEKTYTSYTFGNLTIDFEKHIVTKNDEEIELTPKEFKLVEILIKNIGRVMTKELLLYKIWGYEFVGENGTLAVHIFNLRKKIEDDNKPHFIETIRGKGYIFKNYTT